METNWKQDFTGEDGLLYCGKCGIRKQYRHTFPGGLQRVFPVMCGCEKEEYRRTERARYLRERRERIERRRKVCFPSEQLSERTFAMDDNKHPRVSEICRKYAGQFDEAYQKNLGLVLWGESGTGKTFLACAIANAVLDQDYSAWFTSVSTLTAQMSKNYGEARDEVLDRVRKVQLLILDDFGTQRATEFQNEALYEIVNTRYTAGKPLIITTNLTKAELTETAEGRAEERVISRLKEMTAGFIEVDMEDRRGAFQKEKRQAMIDMVRRDEE